MSSAFEQAVSIAASRARRRRPRADRRRLGARSAAARRRPRRRQHRPRGLRRRRPIACARCSNPFGRVEAVGESFQVYKVGDIDVSLPRRDSKAGRGHRGFVVTGDPGHVDRRGGAAPRFHRQRDLVGSADRRVLRSVRRPRRSRSPDPAHGRSRRPSPTTACACCAPCSSRRGFDFTLDEATARLCRRIPLDDLPSERIWGEIEKLLFAPTPVDRLRARDGSRRRREAVPGAAGALRLPAGARVASGGRRLGAHAAGDRSGADAHRRPRRGRSRSR